MTTELKAPDAAIQAERVWNIPNALTLSRLLLGVVVFALLGYERYFAALVTMVVAAVSDGLDGYVARKLNQCSAIGRQLDPLVDKLIVCGSLIYLLPLGHARTGLWPGMVAVIVGRELIVQAVRSLVEGRGVPFGARMLGKLKTVFQFAGIMAILAILGTGVSGWWLLVRDACLWLGLLLSVLSGAQYLRIAWPVLGGSMATRTE